MLFSLEAMKTLHVQLVLNSLMQIDKQANAVVLKLTLKKADHWKRIPTQKQLD